MPTFREVNTGQTVTLSDDPSYLSGLARWERIEEGPSAPVAAEPTGPVTGPVADSAAGESPQVDAVTEDVTATGPALPADDADRAEWVAYAKSQGKTDAELKGKKVDVIRSWFQ